MKKIIPSLPKGTRDYSPDEMKKREYLFEVFKYNFNLYGFNCIETPSMENSEVLNGKYGEEGDRLIYRILNSGDFLKAEIFTKKLINDNPKIAFLYNLLGLILVKQKKVDHAMKCYEKGIKIDPNFGMIYNNIGFIFFERKTHDSIEKARNFYKKANYLRRKEA